MERQDKMLVKPLERTLSWQLFLAVKVFQPSDVCLLCINLLSSILLHCLWTWRYNYASELKVGLFSGEIIVDVLWAIGVITMNFTYFLKSRTWRQTTEWSKPIGYASNPKELACFTDLLLLNFFCERLQVFYRSNFCLWTNILSQVGDEAMRKYLIVVR
jgi:hypothetical protein